jgi:hypothetical protein
MPRETTHGVVALGQVVDVMPSFTKLKLIVPMDVPVSVAAVVARPLLATVA